VYVGEKYRFLETRQVEPMHVEGSRALYRFPGYVVKQARVEPFPVQTTLRRDGRAVCVRGTGRHTDRFARGLCADKGEVLDDCKHRFDGGSRRI